MTKANELREMADEQLGLTLKEAREGLFRLRLQAETERLDAPSELKKSRRLIARIQTIQNERRRAAAAKQAAAQPAT
jgi:large subunit ribosomal protein L29